MARSLKYVASLTVPVYLECSCRQVEAQRQFGTCEKVFNQEVSFSRCVDPAGVGHTAGFRTAATADTIVMFGRPPKGAGLTQHVADDLRVMQPEIGCGETAGTIAGHHDLLRILADVVVRAHPGHELKRHKIGKLGACDQIDQATTGKILNKYRYGRRDF